MTAPDPPSQFLTVLAGLDPEEFASFVVALWDARGWETDRDDAGTLTVTSPRGTERRIALGHERRIDATQAPVESGVVDTVMSNVDDKWLRTLAKRYGVRFVGPADVYGILRYAVAAEEADRIQRRHLGRSSFEDHSTGANGDAGRGIEGDARGFAPQPGIEARHSRRPVDGGGDESQENDRSALPRKSANGGSSRGPRIVWDRELVLALGSAAILVATLGGAWPLAPTGPGGTPQLVDGPVGGPRGGTPLEAGADGMTNATAVARAHAAAIADRAYTLEIVHHGSRGHVVANRRWVRAHQRLTVSRSGRVTYHVDGTMTPATVAGARRRVAFVETANVTGCVRRPLGPETSDGHPGKCRAITGFDPASNYAGVSEQYVARYLATSRWTVEPLDEGDGYRITATGDPERIYRSVREYRAVARIDPSGLVRRLRVSYRLPGDGGSRTVRFAFRVERADGGP